jgi:hypothetical protein
MKKVKLTNETLEQPSKEQNRLIAEGEMQKSSELTEKSTIFVLYAYMIDVDSEEGFRTNAKMPSYPEYKVMEENVGFYSSLKNAENAIFEHIEELKSRDNYHEPSRYRPLNDLLVYDPYDDTISPLEYGKLHSFQIVEIMLDRGDYYAAETRRSYLRDGSLWAENLTSESVDSYDAKGATREEMQRKGVFVGREPSEIHFKEGDIVEVLYPNRVFLGIVYRTPITVEEVRKRKYYDPQTGYAGAYGDYSDDIYLVLADDDAYNFCEGDAPNWIIDHNSYPIDVFHPRFPVPEALEKSLRLAYDYYLLPKEEFDRLQAEKKARLEDLYLHTDPFYITEIPSDDYYKYVFIKRMLFDKIEFDCSSSCSIFDVRVGDSFYDSLHQTDAYKHYSNLRDIYIPWLESLRWYSNCLYKMFPNIDSRNHLNRLKAMEALIRKTKRLTSKFLLRMSCSAYYSFQKGMAKALANYNSENIHTKINRKYIQKQGRTDEDYKKLCEQYGIDVENRPNPNHDLLNAVATQGISDKIQYTDTYPDTMGIYNTKKSDLFARQTILNRQFEWTDEAKATILRLNRQLLEAEKAVRSEYSRIKAELDTRLAQGDDFLTDYNIEPTICMQILLQNEENEWEEPIEGIYCELNEYLSPDSIWRFFIDAFDENNEPLNWNNLLGDASNHFKNDFIHYGIHELYEHTPLAWEDILKIRSIWAEVKVDYQKEISFEKNKRRYMNIIFYQVTKDKLYAGQYPRMEDDEASELLIREMIDFGFNSFVDLTEADERNNKGILLKPYSQMLPANVRYKRFPIQDVQFPEMEYLLEILDYIDSQLKDGYNVYVHCRGGFDRTGVVVAAWFVYCGMSPADALRLFEKCSQRMAERYGWEPLVSDKDEDPDYISRFYGLISNRKELNQAKISFSDNTVDFFGFRLENFNDISRQAHQHKAVLTNSHTDEVYRLQFVETKLLLKMLKKFGEYLYYADLADEIWTVDPNNTFYLRDKLKVAITKLRKKIDKSNLRIENNQDIGAYKLSLVSKDV